MAKHDDCGRMIDTKGGQSFEIEMKASPSPVLPTPPQDSFKGGVKIQQSTNVQASFTLFKSFLGTGVLALPYAYKTAGLGLALIVILIVAAMTTRCFSLLLEVASARVGVGKISLQKMTQDVLGNKGKYAVQASVMIMQLGCCIGILIFTRDFLNHILCEFGVDSLCNNTLFNVLFCLSLTVPLTLINNMHYFYIPSLAANFFILAGLASQMFYNVQVIQENPELKSTLGSHLKEFNFKDLPLFFGIATYAFEGVGIIFSIRSSMEKPQDFPFLLKNQMAILSIIYVIFPTLCYVALDDRLTDIIFFTLPTDDPFYLLIQILYAISALLSFPVQFFPAIRIMENSKIMRYRLFNERGKCNNKTLRYGMRMAVIALVFLVAYTATSFHLFLNLLGSCVFTFIGFVLPVWIYQVQFKGKVSVQKRIINYTMLVITIFFGATGFVMSIMEMVEKK